MPVLALVLGGFALLTLGFAAAFLLLRRRAPTRYVISRDEPPLQS